MKTMQRMEGLRSVWAGLLFVFCFFVLQSCDETPGEAVSPMDSDRCVELWFDESKEDFERLRDMFLSDGLNQVSVVGVKPVGRIDGLRINEYTEIMSQLEVGERGVYRGWFDSRAVNFEKCGNNRISKGIAWCPEYEGNALQSLDGVSVLPQEEKMRSIGGGWYVVVRGVNSK